MNRNIKNNLLWFLIFFSISSAFAILFQKVFIPLVGLGGDGVNLLEGDARYFHVVARRLSEKIQAEGWSAWRLYPEQGATGNVALLSALYVIFGIDTTVIVPFNAALHALSAIVLIMISKKIWPGRIGRWGGYLIALFFLLSPSTLLWYGQLNKDGIYIAGVFFVLFGWVYGARARNRVWYPLAFVCIGLLLCVFVRPYSLWLISLALVVVFVVTVTLSIFQYGCGQITAEFLTRFLIVGVVVICAATVPKAAIETLPYSSRGGVEEAQDSGRLTWTWQETHWLPAPVDRVAELLAKTRVGLIIESQKVSAGSNVDDARRPVSVSELLFFVPRGLQISLFAPFPSDWIKKPSLGKVIAAVEISVWYLLVFGVFIELFYGKNKIVVDLLIFSIVMLSIYGLTTANLGTLHRIRFPYILILMMVGLAGWVGYLQRNWALKERIDKFRVTFAGPSYATANDVTPQTRKTVAKSGVAVLAFTTITFLGLFVRDIMMARMYGLGHQLDAFVMASVVPMFMVSAFSVPLGTALVPFVGGKTIASLDALSGFVQRIITLYLSCAALFAVAFVVWGMHMLHSSDWGLGLPHGQAAQVEVLSLWMFGIFIMSGILTIANGVLNALGKPYLPAGAQILVPTVVIVVLGLFGGRFGVIVVPIAMFVGQLLNLVLLIRGLAREGISVWPSQLHISFPKEFLAQYFPLIIASVFMQLSVPVSTLMATSLPSGDVGALGLGGKLVVFLTGLITAGLASVVLPYFSSMLVQNRVIDARRELSFLLLSATVASVPVTVLLYLCSSFIVKIFFEGGVFGDDSTLLVTDVMEFGVFQLPFFIVNMIMLKYAIAMQRSGRVLIASLIGLVVNVLLNIWMSRLIGVAGVSLAMSTSVAVTAGLMLLVFFRDREVAWLDLIFILVNWLLFVAMVVCLHYRSWAGVFAAFLAYGLLLYGEWQAVSRGRHVHVGA